MDDQQEFKSIVSEQQRLQQSLDALGQRITAFEQRFQETEMPSTAVPGESLLLGLADPQIFLGHVLRDDFSRLPGLAWSGRLS